MWREIVELLRVVQPHRLGRVHIQVLVGIDADKSAADGLVNRKPLRETQVLAALLTSRNRAFRSECR